MGEVAVSTEPRVAIISANLGNFDPVSFPEPQSEDCDYYLLTDFDFPPRTASMTPRLQARIVKMFMWQFIPGYDIYIWVDSSCRLSHEYSVRWFLEQLGESDIAVFAHPHRKTIQEEADYLKFRLAINCPYITPRYQNEDIDGQLREVLPEDKLLASTAFIYRDSPTIRAAMKEWWYHTSRHHSIDQLSFPFALSGCRVNIINENYLKVPYLEYIRNK